MKRLVILTHKRFDEHYKTDFITFEDLGYEEAELGPKDYCDICGRIILDTKECLGTPNHRWVRLVKDRNEFPIQDN